MLVARVATADTHALSEIRTSVRVDAADGSEQRWPCAVVALPDGWLQGNEELPHGEAYPPDQVTEIRGRERLVVGKHGAELQRVVGTDRSHIPLTVVGHVAGRDVYAFRVPAVAADTPELVVVLVAAPSGMAAYDSDAGTGGVTIVRSWSCGIVETQLQVVGGNSRVGQIQVTAKDTVQYGVSASVSKTSRDGEPVLTVSEMMQKVLFPPK